MRKWNFFLSSGMCRLFPGLLIPDIKKMYLSLMVKQSYKTLTLKAETVGFSETSVINNAATYRNIKQNPNHQHQKYISL